MDEITIEVVCITPDLEFHVQIQVPQVCSMREAVQLSGLGSQLPETLQAPLGVFGRRIANPEATPVQAGDRIEVYRPLLIDPKQARLQRASRSTKG